MMWITHIEGGPKRVNHAGVAVGHKIYSFGGYCKGINAKEYRSIDLHILNTTTFRWTRHPVSDLPYFEYDDIVPFNRYGHTTVAYGDKIYLWGGRNDRESCSVLFCLDTKYNCWTAPKTSGDIPLARDGHSACVWKNYMYIFGGYEEDTNSFLDTIYQLDLDTHVWKHIPKKGEQEPIVRDFHTTVCIQDRMYLFGGKNWEIHRPNNEIYPEQLWYFDFKTNRWHQPVVYGDTPIGRRSHSAFVYNDKMYIFGGYNALVEKHFNDMYEFNPSTNVWKRIRPCGRQPKERRRQVCVLVDDRVFLFGGTSLHSSFTDFTDDEDKLIDHGDMHVLDFKPSLKTLSMIAVRKNKLDDSLLPYHLKVELHNMFAPNRITKTRPNNSAG